MKDKTPERPALQVQWKTEKKLLTLEKIPVLELTLSYPQTLGGGAGGARINRYYQKLAQAWRSRWGRETYCWACIDLVRCREAGRRFHAWQACLEGEVRFQDADGLSIRMDAREIRGDGRPLQVSTGDNWTLPDGVPLPSGRCLPRKRRNRLVKELQAQGEARRAAGDCFLDRDFAQRLPRTLSPHRCCRTAEGWEFYIPQCVLAPAVEGVVTFSLSKGAPGTPV